MEKKSANFVRKNFLNKIKFFYRNIQPLRQKLFLKWEAQAFLVKASPRSNLLPLLRSLIESSCLSKEPNIATQFFKKVFFFLKLFEYILWSGIKGQVRESGGES